MTKRRTAPQPPPAPSFEFQLAGPAVSAQAKNRLLLQGWKRRVADAAKGRWPSDRPPLGHALDVHTSEFGEIRPRRDRDNMAKPILDALQGIAYLNDSQVRSVAVEWCDINGSYSVRHMSPVVAEALVAGEEFVWVRLLQHIPRSILGR
jgi:hypothetical protein